jgi:hypothetical protein
MSSCLAQDGQIWYRKRVSHAYSRTANRDQRRRVIGESRDHTLCELVASNVVDKHSSRVTFLVNQNWMKDYTLGSGPTYYKN